MSSSLFMSVIFALQSAGGVDAAAGETIGAETTDPQFSNAWVAELPDHPSVPSPQDVLGYTVGAEGELTHVDDIHRYFRALAEASPRVELFSLGQSAEDREMIVAVIAEEEMIANLDRYKSITQALADPANTSAEEAEDLIAEGKPLYWITAGLHSTELGPPEAAMEIAYRLAVDERPVYQKIRQNVITLITPVLEVDGRARQVEWTKRHLMEFDDYNDTPPKSPPFWGHYTFHDNNRDGLAISQPLTKNYVQAFYDWQPTFSLDMHESVPLLYVSTGTGPYNQAVDPITVTEWQAIANYEVSRLTGLGMPGVWTWGFYTGWYPGYLLWVTNNHNANGRFYETFGNHVAKTVERDITTRKYANDKITDKTWYRSVPPKRKFDWSMRNNTNYMLSGVTASLEFVANAPDMYLRNFYQKGVNAMGRAVEKAPYAFSIPVAQDDRNAAQDMIDILRGHAIDVAVAERAFGSDDERIDRGDLVVKLNQRYGPLAENLLEKQEFPEKVQVSPYDDVAWTLGLQMGVEVRPISDKAVLDLAARPLGEDEAPFADTAIKGMGRYVVVPHEGQNELGPLRFALGDVEIHSAKTSFNAIPREFPAGSLIIDTDVVDRDALADALEAHGLSGQSLLLSPNVERNVLDLPRVGLLHSWTSTQDAGWARYTLDQSGVPYEIVDKDRARAGGLREDFDVIVVPSFRGGATAGDIIGGVDPKWSPLAYEQTDDTPSHGVIASSPDITGGFGFAGMAEIEKFIRQGGTLIGLRTGGVIAAETGITRKVGISRPSGLNTPGSVLTTKMTRPSPLTYGYEEFDYAFRTNGPLYQVDELDRDLVVMQFGDKVIPEPFEDEETEKDEEEEDEAPPLVRSGAILGGKEIMNGAPALLHEQIGDGQVVLFSWNPLHRHINHHDHAYFYNALLYWNDLKESGQPSE